MDCCICRMMLEGKGGRRGLAGASHRPQGDWLGPSQGARRRGHSVKDDREGDLECLFATVSYL